MFALSTLPSERGAACRLGLQAVDEHVCASQSHGVVRLRTPSADIAYALERHIARRVAGSERQVLRSSADGVDSCWRDIGSQLGLSPIPSNPADAAQTLAEAATRCVVIVLGNIREGSWDHAVLQTLEELTSRALFVVIRWGQSFEPAFDKVGLEARKELFVGGNQEDIEAWWGGIVQEAKAQHHEGTIADMEAWWSWSSRRMLDAPRPDLSKLCAQALTLVSRLRLTGRAWPARWQESLGDRRVWNELADCEVVISHAGHWHLSP
ncbi:MAG: hypothetical protein CSA75_03175, partial [Sorangium cellulosum]